MFIFNKPIFKLSVVSDVIKITHDLRALPDKSFSELSLHGARFKIDSLNCPPPD